MALDPAVFEKLGVFYLGRPCDPATKTPTDVPLLYDSRDLLTHAVCVGMTGSGKTGLCLALLEEAALDGVPAIVIDPKGDLGNLLLTFPELRPEDFRPWINEEDARRKGLEADDFAAMEASAWKAGLEAWGQSGARIRALQEKAELAIYTPGSSSGLPVSVLSSLAAPAGAQDAESLADAVQTTTAGLLGLLKLRADPLQSREGVLLSAILTAEWSQGRSLDLPALIERIQHPAFVKIGVLDLESFYPAKDRFALVLAVNNLLASPGFAQWQQGEPLDVGRFLHTPEGKPRVAIFSIAHLGDDERMFFVSQLLNAVLSWTRAQSGTSSLRALLYMDEIFGYLPPSANPPSKRPLLTLLKQARAFGVGVVVATQNPVDLDYKALSNAGTWLIGRLQTERDKARVLDGLEGASGGAFDRAAMEKLLSGLGQRMFLMNNVHDDGPVLFESRWVMSYLRGPLTKDQIKILTPRRESSPPAAATTSSVPPVRGSGRPAVSPDVPQIFLPGKSGSAIYQPCLLAKAVLRFRDAKLGVDGSREVTMLAAVPEESETPTWEEVPAMSGWAERPDEGAKFAELPVAAARSKSYSLWQKSLAGELASGQRLTVYRCPELKAVSAWEETEGAFRTRVAFAWREKRDAAMDALQKKYAPKFAALQSRLSRAEAGVNAQKRQAGQARMDTMISVGSALLGAFFGRRTGSAALSKASTAARGVGRSWKEGGDVAQAEQNVATVRDQMASLEADFAAEKAALAATEPGFETRDVAPSRGGIEIQIFVLAWKPVPSPGA